MGYTLLNSTIMFLMTTMAFIPLIEDTDVFVSKVKSHDNETCGSYTSPCASIAYAIYNRAKSKDTIRLDGGEIGQLIYVISSTIQLKIDLAITNYNAHLKRPVITAHSYTNLFVTTGNEIRHLHISNIDFRKVGAVEFVAGNTTAIISYCDFNDTQGYVFNQKSGANIFLTVIMTHFHHSNILNFNSTYSGKIIFIQCEATDNPKTENLIHITGKFRFRIDTCLFRNVTTSLLFKSKNLRV